MSRVVFLIEELSMKRLLDELLPRVMPTMAFCCVVHEGREDLEKSIPRTVRAWREPGVRFVVMRDQDGSDCHEVKARLGCLVRQGGRPDVLVRVVCRELEAWYLGEPEALATAYGDARLRQLANRARFRIRIPWCVRAKSWRSLSPAFGKWPARVCSAGISREAAIVLVASGR